MAFKYWTILTEILGIRSSIDISHHNYFKSWIVVINMKPLKMSLWAWNVSGCWNYWLERNLSWIWWYVLKQEMSCLNYKKEDRDNCPMIFNSSTFLSSFVSIKLFQWFIVIIFVLFLLLLVSSIKSSANSHIKRFKYVTFLRLTVLVSWEFRLIWCIWTIWNVWQH